jgi:hypothetical protein
MASLSETKDSVVAISFAIYLLLATIVGISFDFVQATKNIIKRMEKNFVINLNFFMILFFNLTLL